MSNPSLTTKEAKALDYATRNGYDIRNALSLKDGFSPTRCREILKAMGVRPATVSGLSHTQCLMAVALRHYGAFEINAKAAVLGRAKAA